MARNCTSPPKMDRVCEHWWFDAWDWLVNAALRAAGPPRIDVGPNEVAMDIHIHTMFSRCSISRPDHIILRAVELGLGGIGILDHNNPRGIHETERCANELKSKGLIPEDFIIMAGLEISSTRGHIGALFVRESLPGDISPELVVKNIHEAGGLAVAVHPFHSTGIGDALFDIPFDAVEIHCGSVFNREQCERTAALVDDSRLARVAKLGSSDAHYVRGIGSCYSIFTTAERTPDAIRSAIIDCRVSSRQSDHYLKLQRLLGSISKLS